MNASQNMSDNRSTDLSSSVFSGATLVEEDVQQQALWAIPENEEPLQQQGENAQLQDLGQYLSSCHNMHQAAQKLAGGSRRSQATTPEPVGKLYPERIISSPDFMDKQMDVWEAVLDEDDSVFLQNIFPSMEQVHDEYFSMEPINGEMTLCVFERLGMSKAVMTLLHGVLNNEALRQAVGLSGEVTYRPLEAEADGSSVGDDTPAAEPRNSFCVYSNIRCGRAFPVIGIEYRPSDLPMVQEIISALRKSIITERDVFRSGDEDQDPFVFRSKQVVTGTITKLFDRMVKSSVSHGYIYTGEAIIFLEIQDDPSVVHCFASIPKRDASEGDESTMHFSAVGQIFTFIIRALQARPCSVQWHDKAANLCVWRSGCGEALLNLPSNLSAPGPSRATSSGDEAMNEVDAEYELVGENNKAEDKEEANDNEDEDDEANGNEGNGDEDSGDEDSGDEQNGNEDNGDEQNGNEDNGDEHNGNEDNGDEHNGNEDNGDEHNGNEDNGDEGDGDGDGGNEANSNETNGNEGNGNEGNGNEGNGNEGNGNEDNNQGDEDESEEVDRQYLDIDEDMYVAVEINLEHCQDGHYVPKLDEGQQYARQLGEEGFIDDGKAAFWVHNDQLIVSDIRQRRYCSQECLLGLSNGEPLDPACPNVDKHGDEHIGNMELLRMVQSQLTQTRHVSGCCVSLDLKGSLGAMFKVMIPSHGYTFVAKGVKEENVSRLLREADTYTRLKDVQGGCVPVYLGIVQLEATFEHENAAYTHFMLLSWAGRSVGSCEPSKASTGFVNSTRKAYMDLHNAGLIHNDAELGNMLYNPQLDRIMLVDFEHASIYQCHIAEFNYRDTTKGNYNATVEEVEDEEFGGSSKASDGHNHIHNQVPGYGHGGGLRRVNRCENLRKEFEIASERELGHAVNLMTTLAKELRPWQIKWEL